MGRAVGEEPWRGWWVGREDLGWETRKGLAVDGQWTESGGEPVGESTGPKIGLCTENSVEVPKRNQNVVPRPRYKF